MVDIRLMQAAVALAEELNFSRAAHRLNVTQPALSKQIAELEERVGCPLFVRTTQGVEVTDAGAAFVEHARIALSSAERAVHSARAAALGSDAVLSVGKTPYLDPFITSTMMVVRLPLFPQLQLRFSSHYSNEALKLLRSGELDIAVVMGVQEYAGVTSFEIAEDNLYIALQSSDPLCRKTVLTPADMANRRWALFERQVNPAVYDRLQKVFDEDHVRPAEVQHFIQAEEAASLALQRNSLAFLTRNGAWRVSDHVITLRPFIDERVRLKTYLAARTEEQSRLVSEFVRAFMRRLSPPPQQVPLPLAS